MNAPNCCCQFANTLVIAAHDNDCTNSIFQNLFQRDNLASCIAFPIEHNVESIVQHHLGAQLQVFNINSRMSSHPDLATTCQHINSQVVINTNNCSVRTRSTREFVDLIAQRRNVLSGLSKRVRKFFVLTGQSRNLQFQVDRHCSVWRVVVIFSVSVSCHVSPQASRIPLNR